MDTPEISIEKKKFNIVRFLLKTILWICVSIVVLVIAAIALVFIYEDEVKASMVDELNKHLNAEIKIDPQNIDLTVIRTFPNASVDFKDAMCYEVTKKEKRDTLFTSGLITLKFNLIDFFKKKNKI